MSLDGGERFCSLAGNVNASLEELVLEAKRLKQSDVSVFRPNSNSNPTVSFH